MTTPSVNKSEMLGEASKNKDGSHSLHWSTCHLGKIKLLLSLLRPKFPKPKLSHILSAFLCPPAGVPKPLPQSHVPRKHPSMTEEGNKKGGKSVWFIPLELGAGGRIAHIHMHHMECRRAHSLLGEGVAVLLPEEWYFSSCLALISAGNVKILVFQVKARTVSLKVNRRRALPQTPSAMQDRMCIPPHTTRGRVSGSCPLSLAKTMFFWKHAHPLS